MDNTQADNSALFKSAGLRNYAANDADEHASNLTNWKQQYDQISRGQFFGNITELTLPQLQVFKENTSRAVHQKCCVWPKSIWFGLSVDEYSQCRINGMPVKNETVMCRPGDYEFELTTPEDFSVYGLVAEQEAIKEVAAIHGLEINWSELWRNGRLKVPAPTLSGLRYLLNRILSNGELSTGDLKTTTRLQRDIVMIAIIEVIKKETPNQHVKPGYKHRQDVVKSVRDYLSMNKQSPLTITELCQISNVSRRTLQYSFETILGISPVQYLRAFRLNGVRRDLRSYFPGSSQTSCPVAAIASTWGFSHLSQFALDYKLLFGESPSVTLAKLPG